ncbi:MAG: MFS transporter [Proteobacteria bacterium]|jgi:MFS family permease|nr:MFS transporter [Pseudomonadota bacterium]
MNIAKSKIPLSIWAIGFASMLLNISTVMVFGVVALYLKQILGAGTGFIIMLEGTFEAMAFAMKLLSGLISDYFRRPKKIMMIGFAMVTISRPIFALFATVPMVIIARLFDRLGNGMQSTPRDALVGDLAPDRTKGACFGLRNAMATAGSFIGGILGIVAMYLANQDIQQVFMWASIPASIGFFLLLIFVKDPHEKEVTADKKPIRHPLHFKDLTRLGKPYWMLMIVAMVFMSSRIGESMLVLHATQSFGMDQNFSHGILILYNCTNSLFSYPIGMLSDRLGRYGFLALSFVLLIVADAFLGFSTSLPVMLIGVGLWGIQIGMSQDMFLCIIADHVPEDLRGTGIGFYYLINSVGLLLAGFIGGSLADKFDQFVTFMGSGLIALFALILLILLRPTIDVKIRAT